MGDFQTKDNSGALFRNDRKTDDRHPNAKGKALVGGRWYWLSAWTKSSRDGDKFQSLAFEAMTDEQAAKYGGNTAGGSPARRPEPARQSSGGGSRSRTDPAVAPFGDEKVFEESDIPFAWHGRAGQPV